MKAQEIRELSSKERKEKITDLRQEYFNLKIQLAIGKIENPGRWCVLWVAQDVGIVENGGLPQFRVQMFGKVMDSVVSEDFW